MKRPLWMIELDLDYRDLQRQRYDWLPDLVAIVAACLLVAGATAAAIFAWGM